MTSNLKPPARKSGDNARVRALALAEVEIKANPRYDFSVKPAPVTQVQYQLQVMRHSQMGGLSRQVQLTCSLGPADPAAQVKYLGKLTTLADIEFDPSGTLTDEERDERAVWIGASQLIGANRGHIQAITGVAAYGALLVGPVDVTKLVASSWVVEASGAKPRRLFPDRADAAAPPPPASTKRARKPRSPS